MKKFGWFCIVIGSLALIGTMTSGSNPTGPTFWLALGIFLVYRANQKKQDEKDKESWKNSKSNDR